MGRVIWLLAGAVATLIALLAYQNHQLDGLRAEIERENGARAAYKAELATKTKNIEQYTNEQIKDVSGRYGAILERLRKSEQARVRADRAATVCTSERGADAARMQSELLRGYASIARYADELRQRGLACEKICSVD